MPRTALLLAAALAVLPAVLPVALPVQAADLVSSRLVERGDAERVKDAAGAPAAEPTAVDVVFGMGSAASRGFTPAAGGSEAAVSVARGPRPPLGTCPAEEVRLP